MPRLVCPSAAELSAFAVGKLSAALLEEIADHLEQCPICEAAVQRLDRMSDQFVTSLKGLSGISAPVIQSAVPLLLPAQIGDYEMLGELGRGGMGIVYKARHTQLGRVVALKMLLGGEFAHEDSRKRFRAEAEAVARLQHPNIVQIFDIGEWHAITGAPPVPYFTLEYVDGGSLSTRLTRTPQSPKQAADWLLTLAQAVHYAHSQGIIHRDLKPSNVLMTADGQLKLCDFGVAKRLTGGDLKTLNDLLVGTPEYMAPEQAEGQGRQAGPATDVYALGAILYVMLTGRPPFQADSVLETLEQVRTQEPVPPRRLQPRLPRDLETICLKCLEKEPGRRYAGAAALVEDLRRFLAGEPIRARPAHAWERAWKWAKRRPVVAALAAAVVLVTVLGFSLVAWQWRRAELKAAQIERLSAGMSLTQGVTLCEKGEVDRGLLWLVHALELAERGGDRELGRVARQNLAMWQPFLLPKPVEFAHPSWVWAVAFSPDGLTVLTGSADKTARLWDAATGRPKGETLQHSHPVWAVAFSPDGRTVLTGSGDDAAGEARLWDAVTGRPLRPPLPQPGEVTAVAFRPDGQAFLTVCPEQVQLWKTADAQPIGPPLKHSRPAHPDQRVAPKMTAAFSPDGKLIATGGEDGTIRLWDAVTAEPHGEPLRTSGPVLVLSFSPDSRTLATGSFDGGAQMWDVATGRPRGPVLRHPGRVKAVAFSPDGTMLATGCVVEDDDPETGSHRINGGQARLWRAATGRALGAPLEHPAPVWAVAFSPGGRLLLTGCEDGGARFFLTANGMPIGKPLAHEGLVQAVAFRPDGTAALTASAGGNHHAAARLWRLPPERLFGRPLPHAGHLQSLAVSPDGRTLLAGADDRTARLWDLSSGRLIDPPLSHGPAGRPRFMAPNNSAILAVAFSPDGHTLLTASEGGDVRLWDRADHHLLSQFSAAEWLNTAGFSPDGRVIAISRRDGPPRAWETATGKPLNLPLKEPVWSVAFSPDGQQLLTRGDDRVQLVERAPCRLLHELSNSAGWNATAFYPDGKRILLVSRGFAQVWDTATGQVSASPLFQSEGGIERVAFSAAGQTVLIISLDRVARLWDVATGMPLGPPLCRDAAGPATFFPDGHALAVADRFGKIGIWDVPSPLEGSAEQLRLRFEMLTGMALDAQGTIHELSAEAQQQRHLEETGGRNNP